MLTRTLRSRISRIGALRNDFTTFSRQQSTIPYTETCPSPTCPCTVTPAGLDIDRKTPLLHTMAPYSSHVLLCTGKPDWTSRIEDETSPAGHFTRALKERMGKGGKAFDPFNNVLTTACSFDASSDPNATTVLLFPAFKRIRNVPHTAKGIDALISAYLKAQKLHSAHAPLSDAQKAELMRDPSLATHLSQPEPVTKPTVLICGHGGRDQRCGVLGPILQDGFRADFARRNLDADVGLISHIGGHKYAGNVIIYLPPNMEDHPLSGAGIWYGRVRPEDVEGLVEETIVKGRVIIPMLRGGVTVDGSDIGRIVEAQLKIARGEDMTLKLKPRTRA